MGGKYVAERHALKMLPLQSEIFINVMIAILMSVVQPCVDGADSPFPQYCFVVLKTFLILP